MFVNILVFLLSAASILLGSHYFILYSIFHAFDVTHPRLRLVLLLAFSALAVSFPLAMLLHRLHANLFTRAFHVFASFWIGLAIHLVFFLLLSWAIYGLSRAVGRPIHLFLPLMAAVVVGWPAMDHIRCGTRSRLGRF